MAETMRITTGKFCRKCGAAIPPEFARSNPAAPVCWRRVLGLLGGDEPVAGGRE